jgi:deoxyribodipyrimidine photolyase-related protein
MTATHTRKLLLVLGDQLDENSLIFEHADPEQDEVWMAETHTEATHVWCHKLRLVFFFSAMRHFADMLRRKGFTVHYHPLTADPSNDRGKDFLEILNQDLPILSPQEIVLCPPGDFRVQGLIRQAAENAGIPLSTTPDPHFYATAETFRDFQEGRKTLVMEPFYRQMRKTHHILIEDDGTPSGGEWNFDKENRNTFGKDGPPKIKAPLNISPNEITRDVIKLVNTRFARHPGTTEYFDLPVTREDALDYLEDFIEHRLPDFGTYEDAMWQREPFLYHSRLSAVLNVKLLNPRDCVDRAVEAYHSGKAPIHSVEGFVRQILGWREFIRGVYWSHMPDYAELNALECPDRDVPDFFWTGETEMACAADCMQSVLRYAWSHHIPRLMVLGQFSLLLGVHPKRFNDWHVAMYADAIDWVSLPNTLGMSQYGDGGIVGTKPYCASGNYINRMSNFCKSCVYNPKKATGKDACPFTTLYWDFLDRHRESFSSNRRMTFQLKNLERKSEEELKDIRKQAQDLRDRYKPRA